ncbi:hypothetical protein [Dissulfurimicrobium sp.]
MNYETRYIENYKDLIKKLKYNTYHLIFLHQQDPAFTEDINAFLDYINFMPPDTRRQSIVVVIMPNAYSRNPLTAFSLGADFIIQPADLLNLAKIIQDEITSKEKKYRVFLDCKANAARN